jgi:hypothetical protein
MVYSILKGRIGNNLFQIAIGLSFANKNNDDFIAYIPKFVLPEPDNCYLRDYLKQFENNILRNIKFTEKLPPIVDEYQEKTHTFTPIQYQNNILLNGYFQSEKYFNKTLIKELFSIDYDTNAYIQEKYGLLLKDELTSINVRHGDFLNVPQYHPVCSLKYFKNAIKYIGENKKYLVISDNIEWCKKKFKGSNFHFVENEKPTIDLYLQTLCKNNIISNSSFSWWAAWLNNHPQKKVIMPKNNWFGILQRHLDTNDMFPDDWIKLPNPIEFKIKMISYYHLSLKKAVLFKKRINKLTHWRKSQ